MNIIVGFEEVTGAIGLDGQLFCSLPEDLRHFRETTSMTNDPNLKNVVVMGRKTWESLPRKPLPNRINIVMSRSLEQTENVIILRSLDDVLNYLKTIEYESVFIIGGAEIYKAFLERENLVDRIIATVYTPILQKSVEADTFFPLDALDKKFKQTESPKILGRNAKYQGIVRTYERSSPTYNSNNICLAYCG